MTASNNGIALAKQRLRSAIERGVLRAAVQATEAELSYELEDISCDLTVILSTTPASGAAEMREAINILDERAEGFAKRSYSIFNGAIVAKELKFVADMLRALPLPVASLPDREAIARLLKIAFVERTMHHPVGPYQESLDHVFLAMADALHSASSTKSHQSDGGECACGKFDDGKQCPDSRGRPLCVNPAAPDSPNVRCPNCNDANEYGDYEGPTCEVCGGVGRVSPSTKSDGEKSV
jgi:hypothetical protein